jgi:hypothetical protein
MPWGAIGAAITAVGVLKSGIDQKKAGKRQAAAASESAARVMELADINEASIEANIKALQRSSDFIESGITRDLQVIIGGQAFTREELEQNLIFAARDANLKRAEIKEEFDSNVSTLLARTGGANIRTGGSTSEVIRDLETDADFNLSKVQLDLDKAIFSLDQQIRKVNFEEQNSIINAEADLAIAKFNEEVALDTEARRKVALRKEAEIQAANLGAAGSAAKAAGKSALYSSILGSAGKLSLAGAQWKDYQQKKSEINFPES